MAGVFRFRLSPWNWPWRIVTGRERSRTVCGCIALAEEVAGKDILVNAVAPSILDTPANRKDMPKADHAAWPKVDEVARTILFLASSDNKVTRGTIVPVYGKV